MEGRAELEWVSASTFRFARSWEALPRRATPINKTAVGVTAEDLGPRWRFTTRYLRVDVEKTAGRLEIRDTDLPLTTGTVVREGPSVVVEETVGAAERFYGLGSRGTANLDLRGSIVETKKAFLISSGGYGEYFRSGTCRFDLAASRPDRRRVTVQGNRVEYFFYYGPTPKEIVEEHLGAAAEVEDFGSAALAIRKPKVTGAGEATWAGLREVVYQFQHESMSAMLVPSLDLSRYQAAGGALFARAAQLAAFIPTLSAAEPKGGEDAYRAMVSWRARLVPYLLAYGNETETRGIPLIRSMAMQFPRDPIAAKRTAQFMVGDELLVAPVLEPAETVLAYLPQGIWTDLRTNEVHKGRKEITVRAVPDRMPIFARNGTILPLAAETPGGPMELHYFPKLGAEFFLYEEDLGEISQVHASPAAEFMRLESESFKERTYEWIVHHVPPCRKVRLGGADFVKVDERARLAPGSWYYDAERESLHVMVRSTTGGDEIVNISF